MDADYSQTSLILEEAKEKLENRLRQAYEIFPGDVGGSEFLTAIAALRCVEELIRIRTDRTKAFAERP